VCCGRRSKNVDFHQLHLDRRRLFDELWNLVEVHLAINDFRKTGLTTWAGATWFTQRENSLIDRNLVAA
jgi:hypothetical protein